MFWNDLRHALRMLWQAPGFSTAVALTIALAIAGNAAIFSIVNAELLRPLPFRDPDRLVQVAEKNDKLNLPSFSVSVLNFDSWREQSRSFEALAGVGAVAFTMTDGGEPEQVSGDRFSPALLRVLGLAPIAGRDFTDDEEKPGAAPAAMISEGLWKRRFGGDWSVLGRVVTLNGTPTTIVGISPPSLNLITGGDVYIPLSIDPGKEVRLNHVIGVFARLQPGVSMLQAQAEMDGVSAHMNEQYPELRDWGIRLIDMTDTFVTPPLKTGLLVLMCAVGFVLLIACANIANLLLARATARQRELAVRAALGASRNRLIAQLLAESTVLAAMGGVAGLAGAHAVLRLITRALPPTLLPVPQIQIDGRVLLFAAALTLLSALLSGLMPAWRMARVDLNDLLKQAGRGTTGAHGRLRQALAGGEVALATVLLIGAGLLIQTLANLQRARLGFEPHGLITFQLAPPTTQYPVAGPGGAPGQPTPGKAQQFYPLLRESLQSLPGVVGVAISSGIPFGAGTYAQSPWTADGSAVLGPDASVPIDWRAVNPGYFKTMNIALLRGREFTDGDNGQALVVIASQAAAKKLLGDVDPIGMVIHRPAGDTRAFTVVGVVGDVRSTALNQESPSLYFPTGWRVFSLMDVAVRTQGDPRSLLPGLRQKVHELDSGLAMANVRTMDDWVRNNAAQPRLNAVLLGVFAALAMLIAAIGIYGVLAYSVTQRTREIGVRLALGAPPSRVLRLVLVEGMKVSVTGMVIGLLGGLALGRALQSIVYGVPVHDPFTYAVVATVLIAVSFLACLIPARRAAQVDPMVALRCE